MVLWILESESKILCCYGEKPPIGVGGCNVEELGKIAVYLRVGGIFEGILVKSEGLGYAGRRLGLRLDRGSGWQSGTELRQ